MTVGRPRRLTTAVQQAVDRFSGPWERLEAASAAHLQELCTGDDFTSSAIQTELPRLSDAKYVDAVERQLRNDLAGPRCPVADAAQNITQFDQVAAPRRT